MLNDVACNIIDSLLPETPDVMALLEQEFGGTITTGNWNTVLKVAARI